MLNTLTIWNFALLEQVQIDFDKGLNILTGETGAGKSILIDALGAMLGNRLSTDFIRDGADWLRVEAIFSIDNQPKVVDYLTENAIDASEGEIIITRQITSNGRGTILINGCHTTVSVLKKLGNLLVNIHGQNENLALLNATNQYKLVDGSDDRIKGALADYQAAYKALKEKENELEEKERTSADNEQKLDMLRWQVQEIEAAQLQENEDEELERDIKKLSNAERISKYIGEACQNLYGGNCGMGIVSGLEEVVENLKDLSRFDDSLESVTNIIREASIQIKEAAYEVRDYGDELEFNPQLLDKLQGRMDVIDKLRKKYGATIEDILSFKERAQEQLNDIENYDDDIAALRQEIQKLQQQAATLAQRLRELRIQAGERLSMAIEDHLHELGMPDARLEIAVNEAGELTNMGADALEILFSANPGQELRPIQRVASGGELSRIALSIKAVTAFRDDSPASMIFDEIDTGIGGRTAQMVAERIAMVAADKQVLCITHLPQIACMADVHLYINKQVIKGKTYTSVRPLTDGERVNEIARMASGVDVSAASLDNAREMLANAGIKKQQYASR